LRYLWGKLHFPRAGCILRNVGISAGSALAFAPPAGSNGGRLNLLPVPPESHVRVIVMSRLLEVGFLVLVFAGMVVGVVGSAHAADTLRVYFGTYTGGDSQGVYTSVLDLKTGKLTPPVLAA